ncbi:hypothetical protein PPERSA_07220 [Pseudocohnilembus persalinus]|uniref:ABC3 transporter permease C-terminal domain-containing protein n=1 Tax=Pseudocohnilembus persalinus TaxID=266149 RepID=A0A0V0QD19_PSEPJ|nr:hypothetical protein PPERSA_07220 [Pseudocohnilembus persalinus]|eukprot:KRX00113.1 hypothetical protein PPERSA_07220 [Pseudocohnilembus persalinus]
MKRRPCYYCLSFMSVAIVVMACAVSQSIIDRAPIIFLKTAEGPGGEIDVNITPNFDTLMNVGGYSLVPYLNGTRVQELVQDDLKQQLSPRQEVIGKSFLNCQYEFDEVNTRCRYYKEGSMLLINSEKEEYLQLGREYPYGKIEKGKIIIIKKFALDLDVKKGDKLFFRAQLSNYISTIVQNLCYFDPDLDFCDDFYPAYVSEILLEFEVQEILEEPFGKVSNDKSKTYFFVEYEYFHDYLGEYLLKVIYANKLGSLPDMIKKINPFDYSQQIIMNTKDRIDLYLDSNYDNIQLTISKMASRTSEALGVYPINLKLPVLEELYDLRYGQMFLGIMLNMIIFILFILSLLLLYNLLLVSIETKTFELGVLRTLGLNKIGIVSLIIVQALSYVIPALIVGLLLSLVGLHFTSNALESSLGVSLSIIPTFNAFFYAIGVGILIPLFSSIVPIRNALGVSLSIALDVNRSKSQAVKIEIDVEGKGFPWGRIGFALVATLFGISIYYFLPLSLLSLNIGLLINIFFWILIGLLVGFILLMLNIQYLLERMVVVITLVFLKSAQKSIILKNLAAHRIKNRRVAIMYSLSIAFIIFVWTFSIIQMKSSDYQERREEGTYLTVEYSGPYVSESPFLPIDDFEKILTEDLKDYIESFSWITISLEDLFDIQGGYTDTYVTHLGKIYTFDPYIHAVSPNFMSTTFSEEFLNLKERAYEDIGLDIIEELYTPRGSQSVVMTEDVQEAIKVGMEYDDSFFLVMKNSTNSEYQELRISTVIESGPVFNSESIIVSLPTFQRLCGELALPYDKIPMERLLIKTINQDDSTVDIVYSVLSQYISQKGYYVDIWDYRDFEKGILEQQNLINIIFSVITVIVMILSFFSLISSMTANIYEQTKEISVLRAIGMTKYQMIMTYIYEAYTLVLSSSLIGMIVGIIVGFTMGLQRALFTKIPIPFEFPTQIFVSVFITSIFCAFLSTYFPSKRIMNSQISQIIRLTG